MAALAARTIAIHVSAITTIPQIGIPVSGDVRLPKTLSLVAWGAVGVLVMVLVVLVLVLVLELVLVL